MRKLLPGLSAWAGLVSLFACAHDVTHVVVQCGTHELFCDGACVAIDNHHCGGCGACTGGLSCIAKPDAKDGYACDCTPEEVRCPAETGSGFECIDPVTPDHCGACGNVCQQGAACARDWTQPFDAQGNHPFACLCRAPYANCGTVCADILEDDATNCGACGKHCAADEVCISGSCHLAGVLDDGG